MHRIAEGVAVSLDVRIFGRICASARNDYSGWERRGEIFSMSLGHGFEIVRGPRGTMLASEGELVVDSGPYSVAVTEDVEACLAHLCSPDGETRADLLFGGASGLPLPPRQRHGYGIYEKVPPRRPVQDPSVPYAGSPDKGGTVVGFGEGLQRLADLAYRIELPDRRGEVLKNGFLEAGVAPSRWPPENSSDLLCGLRYRSPDRSVSFRTEGTLSGGRKGISVRGVSSDCLIRIPEAEIEARLPARTVFLDGDGAGYRRDLREKYAAEIAALERLFEQERDDVL
ncbi:MAG: hypothetical protein ACOX8X_06010, partial [Methanomethylophilus sp.]